MSPPAGPMTSQALERGRGTAEDSFADGLLEYPQYTRAADFRGWAVPEVLLSGHHEPIRRWRRKASLRRTGELRPDLLEGRSQLRKIASWWRRSKTSSGPRVGSRADSVFSGGAAGGLRDSGELSR